MRLVHLDEILTEGSIGELEGFEELVSKEWRFEGLKLKKPFSLSVIKSEFLGFSSFLIHVIFFLENYFRTMQVVKLCRVWVGYVMSGPFLSLTSSANVGPNPAHCTYSYSDINEPSHVQVIGSLLVSLSSWKWKD